MAREGNVEASIPLLLRRSTWFQAPQLLEDWVVAHARQIKESSIGSPHTAVPFEGRAMLSPRGPSCSL
jgi:hypothetical protein